MSKTKTIFFFLAPFCVLGCNLAMHDFYTALPDAGDAGDTDSAGDADADADADGDSDTGTSEGAAALRLENEDQVVNGYVRIADSPSLEPTEFTLEGWVTPLGGGYGSTADTVGAVVIGKVDPQRPMACRFIDPVIRQQSLDAPLNLFGATNCSSAPVGKKTLGKFVGCISFAASPEFSQPAQVAGRVL